MTSYHNVDIRVLVKRPLFGLKKSLDLKILLFEKHSQSNSTCLIEFYLNGREIPWIQRIWGIAEAWIRFNLRSSVLPASSWRCVSTSVSYARGSGFETHSFHQNILQILQNSFRENSNSFPTDIMKDCLDNQHYEGHSVVGQIYIKSQRTFIKKWDLSISMEWEKTEHGKKKLK